MVKAASISPIFQFTLFTLGFIYLSNDTAIAQVTPDGTVNTQVTQNGNVAEITGGETRGSNLFHSFKDFSVETGNSAAFNNANDLSNIFSRVTGGNISNIDGLISANGNANLFLINPAGIIFNENASLDIGGSFYASSASNILFEDGEFSTTDINNPPLLTVNAPIGLGFRSAPGDIINRSVSQNPNGERNVTGGAVGLQVPNGETLALIGGNVLLDDGNLTAKGGQIEIGSILGQGEIRISKADIGFILDYGLINSLGNITLDNTAVVDVTASGGGSINVNGNNLLLKRSSINAGITSNLSSFDAQAGNINFNAVGTIQIDDANILNYVGTNSIGNAGNITINAGDLNINSSQVFSGIFGRGNSGDITINASESVNINGERPNERNGVGSPGGLFAQVEITGEGQAGNINIDTKLLSISNGSKIQVASFGKGNAGNLIIRANQIEVFNDPIFSDYTTGIFATLDIDPLTENPPQGLAGDIDITTQSLKLKDGGNITVSTSGIGDAGNITIKAQDYIEVSGVDPEPDDGSSQIAATVYQGAIGNGGNINIETGQLVIQDQGKITAETTLGKGGEITLKITENLILNGNSLISAQAFNNANGGNVNIDTNFIVAFPNANSLNGNNDIIANAQLGEGGNVNVTAESLFGIQEGELNSQTNDINASSDVLGLDGTVTINTPDFNPVQRVVELPANLIEAEQTTEQACQANRDAAAKNELTIKGKGGVPVSPDQPLTAQNLIINGQINTASATAEPIDTSIGKIKIARGIKIRENGQVILTAYPTEGIKERLPQGKTNCGQV